MMPIQTTPAPAASAPTPAPQTSVGTATPAPVAVTTADPAVVYRGLREKREVLWNQKSRLEQEREEIAQALRSGPVGDIDRTGLEQRLAAVDQRIAQVSINIAEADAEVAASAAVPGALVREVDPNGNDAELLAMGLVFTGIMLFPLVIAWARRLWKKAATQPVVSQELTDRVGAIERNLDSVAFEIERIGEGQRFVTQLMAERVQPHEALREALPEPRKSPPA
jgi:hypothetical protein